MSDIPVPPGQFGKAPPKEKPSMTTITPNLNEDDFKAVQTVLQAILSTTSAPLVVYEDGEEAINFTTSGLPRDHFEAFDDEAERPPYDHERRITVLMRGIRAEAFVKVREQTEEDRKAIATKFAQYWERKQQAA